MSCMSSTACKNPMMNLTCKTLTSQTTQDTTTRDHLCMTANKICGQRQAGEGWHQDNHGRILVHGLDGSLLSLCFGCWKKPTFAQHHKEVSFWCSSDQFIHGKRIYSEAFLVPSLASKFLQHLQLFTSTYLLLY